MIVFTDQNGCIKAVGESDDPSLTRQEIDDDSFFEGWSKSKICCYKVQVQDGRLVMATPYIDSRLLEQFDMMGHQTEAITPYTATKTAYIDDTEITFTDVPKGNLSVYMQDEEGNYPHYTAERMGNIVTIHFEPLEAVTTVTISIIGG